MRKQHKEIYVSQHGNDDGFEAYLTSLEQRAAQTLMQTLRKNILHLPAKDFTLTDMDGRQVSLAHYTGKVVFLDLWATWCGPCVASFPALQKVVNKYKPDSSVVFLFINTFEKVPDNERIQLVRSLLHKNNYTIQVLLDKAVDYKKSLYTLSGSYGINSLPTKIVIDTKGIIRFIQSGATTDDTQLLNEITAMIQLVKN